MNLIKFDDFLMEDDGGGEGFSGFGSIEGMGNPSTPNGTENGSGDTFTSLGVYHNTSGHSLKYVQNFTKKQKGKKGKSKQLKNFKDFFDEGSKLQQK
jgi:hypothetical protein